MSHELFRKDIRPLRKIELQYHVRHCERSEAIHVVLIFWIASGSAFAMTMLNTAFEITYCIFPEEVYTSWETRILIPCSSLRNRLRDISGNRIHMIFRHPGSYNFYFTAVCFSSEVYTFAFLQKLFYA
jgi:hypothetical protein